MRTSVPADIMTAAAAHEMYSRKLRNSVEEHLGDTVLQGVQEKIEEAIGRYCCCVMYRLNKLDFFFEDAERLAEYLTTLGYWVSLYPEDEEEASYCIKIDWMCR